MTSLAQLVSTSQRVSAASARLTKVRELSSLLKALASDEIETVVHYLSGELPQGRIGISYKALRAAAQTAADQPALSIAEVDRSLAVIAEIRGSGSAAQRAQALAVLFSRATPVEQEFLIRLF